MQLVIQLKQKKLLDFIEQLGHCQFVRVMFIMWKTGQEGYPFWRHIFVRVVDTVEWSLLLSSLHSKFATIDPPSIQSIVWPVFCMTIFARVELCSTAFLTPCKRSVFRVSCLLCLTNHHFVLQRKLRPPLWQPLCATNHDVWVNAAVANSTNYPILASLVSCLYGRIMCNSKR
jgi:hypothetical protein